MMHLHHARRQPGRYTYTKVTIRSKRASEDGIQVPEVFLRCPEGTTPFISPSSGPQQTYPLRSYMTSKREVLLDHAKRVRWRFTIDSQAPDSGACQPNRSHQQDCDSVRSPRAQAPITASPLDGTSQGYHSKMIPPSAIGSPHRPLSYNLDRRMPFE